MSVIEALTEEELALHAILSDPSGIDQAEFFMLDEMQPDRCWRAWPYQWKWYRCTDSKQAEQSARSGGKSLSIKLRGFAFPFVHPGQEMVVTAPELIHLEPITKLIEDAFFSTRIGRVMLQKGRSAVSHRPFQVNFKNGASIKGRIPQRDGKGVKGIHPVWLEMDESQDFPAKGFTEIIETLNRGAGDGACWRIHGVTKGVRDDFYELTTDPDKGFTVHRYTAQWRPTWNDAERKDKEAMYGSRDDPDYRRNVLGAHGDATSPLFVLHRLMQCVDSDIESAYNVDEYVFQRITAEEIADNNGMIESLLELPGIHTDRYRTFWCGMDVGWTQAPSEILVFAEETIDKTAMTALRRAGKAAPVQGETRLKLLNRIQLVRVGEPDQTKVIVQVLAHYRPRAFAMDSTGAGLPLFQRAQEQNPDDATRIKGYTFSSKILVAFDNTKILPNDITKEELVKEAGILRNVKEYSTDRLRYLVDNQRLWMPWDKDFIGEFEGATVEQQKMTIDQYGKRYSAGKDHALDASRMAAMGWSQYAIEEFVQKPEKPAPVIDYFG